MTTLSPSDLDEKQDGTSATFSELTEEAWFRDRNGSVLRKKAGRATNAVLFRPGPTGSVDLISVNFRADAPVVQIDNPFEVVP